MYGVIKSLSYEIKSWESMLECVGMHTNKRWELRGKIIATKEAIKKIASKAQIDETMLEDLDIF